MSKELDDILELYNIIKKYTAFKMSNGKKLSPTDLNLLESLIKKIKSETEEAT